MGRIPLFRDADEAGHRGARDDGVDVMWIGKQEGEWLFWTEVRVWKQVEDVEFICHIWYHPVMLVRRCNGQIDNGHHVVFAVHPYRPDFRETAPFRPPAKEGVLARKPPRREFGSARGACERKEPLSYECWKTENSLTASLPLNRWARARGECRLAHIHRRVSGAFSDRVAVRRDLFSHRNVTKLINMNEDGTLRIRTCERGLPEVLRGRPDQLKLIEHTYLGILHTGFSTIEAQTSHDSLFDASPA